MDCLAKIYLTFRLEAVFSLKQKRSMVKRIKSYVSKTFNACISESHEQDSLRYIGLTIGLLSHNKDDISSIKQKITEEIEMICEGFVEEEFVDII